MIDTSKIYFIFKTMKSQEKIIRYQVPGARRFSNYIWGLF